MRQSGTPWSAFASPCSQSAQGAPCLLARARLLPSPGTPLTASLPTVRPPPASWAGLGAALASVGGRRSGWAGTSPGPKLAPHHLTSDGMCQRRPTRARASPSPPRSRIPGQERRPHLVTRRLEPCGRPPRQRMTKDACFVHGAPERGLSLNLLEQNPWVGNTYGVLADTCRRR